MFDGEIATIVSAGTAVPAECRTGIFQIHVLRFGGAPFGLAYLLMQDDCVGRRADMALRLLWLGE